MHLHGQKSGVGMDIGDTTSKNPWEAPATVTLTDTESRADQRDVGLRNGADGDPTPVSA